MGKRDDWAAVRELLDQAQISTPQRVRGFQFDYLRARVCMSEARFEEARQLLTQVVRDPGAAGTQTAAMSQWLIGESWFHQEDYASALRAYLLVDSLYDFPQWQALALLQAAKCQERMNDRTAARITIDRLMATFPESNVTVDARQLLLQMRRDESTTKTAPATFSKPVK
jgi:TolA-binding protein